MASKGWRVKGGKGEVGGEVGGKSEGEVGGEYLIYLPSSYQYNPLHVF